MTSMATAPHETESTTLSGTVVAPAPEPSAPVKVWALIGLVSTAVVLSTWARWVSSSRFRSIERGPDVLPAAHALAMQILQWGLFIAAVGLIWWCLVRPILKTHALTFDGKLVIAGVLAICYEPLASIFTFSHSYNAELFNRGSWAGFIPLWQTPHSELLVHPPVLIFGMYVCFFAGGPIIGCWILRQLRRRFPTQSNLALTGWLGLAWVGIDVAFEVLILRSEVYAYPTTPRSLTLWAGHSYQLPLLSAVFAGIAVGGFGALRYFLDQDGRSLPERGLDKLPRRGRGLISGVAIIGCTHAWMIVSWMVPMNLTVALQGETAPTLPSYLSHGICVDQRSSPCP